MPYYDPYQNGQQTGHHNGYQNGFRNGSHQSMDRPFGQHYTSELSDDFVNATSYQRSTNTYANTNTGTNTRPGFEHYYQIYGDINTDFINRGQILSGDSPAPYFDKQSSCQDSSFSSSANTGVHASNQSHIDHSPKQQQQWKGYLEPCTAYTQNAFVLPIQSQNHLQSHQSDHSQDHNYAPVSQHLAGTDPLAPSRTVYLGNLPKDIEPSELLDYVRSGILENVKILPSKNCAFVSFVDLQSALFFHLDCILKKLSIKGHDVRVGWGKNTPILPAVKEAMQKDGATRNVYLGNLHTLASGETISEDELRADLANYGVIDCVKIIPEKGIAFVHFLSILSAIRCVANLPMESKYLDKKCFYGKDRSAFITKTQQHNAAQYVGLVPNMEHVGTAADREFIFSALAHQSAVAAQIATQAGGVNNLGNRTVYLGNLHQELSVEEICNVVRGGLLQSIRFLKERHMCFVTFIDPIAAAQFFAMCQLHGLTIHNRRIKVGWGKHSGPLSSALSLAVSNGASRNIYVGNINDFEYFNAQKLRDDFSAFGEIEQINYLQAKNCAFINFVNIANGIKAIDGIKSLGDYKTLKINFGKDRCGNLPRQFQPQAQNQAQKLAPNQQQQQQHFSRNIPESPELEYKEDL